ncbi:MAG TPA: TetR/AcrR family transcriptional regulator [Pyrinomonadaceae bacterium]|jgi:AcrR family transcriptional regulator
MQTRSIEETKAHILEIAREQFFKKGYAATSINTIVDAADVTKPTVYYHFKNKEGLFAALVEEAYDRCYEHRSREVDENATTAEKIYQVVNADFNFCLSQPELLRFVLSMTFAVPEEHGIDVKTKHLRDYEFFYDLIEKGIDAGELYCSDTGSAALALQGIIAVNIMSFLEMEHAPDFLSPQRAREVTNIFLRGVVNQPPAKRGKQGDKKK